MKKLFLPYNLSLKLKRIGFNEPCVSMYDETGYLCNDVNFNIENDDTWISNKKLHYDVKKCAAPLITQVFDWFEKKYKLSGMIELGTQEYSYLIYDVKKNRRYTGNETLSFNGTKREAKLKCIEVLIESRRN